MSNEKCAGREATGIIEKFIRWLSSKLGPGGGGREEGSSVRAIEMAGPGSDRSLLVRLKHRSQMSDTGEVPARAPDLDRCWKWSRVQSPS